MDKRIATIVARHIRGEKARNNNPDFNPDLDALLTLEDIMVPLNRALRSLTKAYTNFIKIKLPRVTPDGMIGGKGYVMPVKDIKVTIDQTIENLTGIINAIEDEVSNNPVWQEAKRQREEEQKQDLEEEQKDLEEESYEDEEEDAEDLEEVSEDEEELPSPNQEVDLNLIPEFMHDVSQGDIQNLEEEMRSP